MTTDSPFFSIIIPTYNRAQLIARTLKSVLLQTYPSFEIIVVEDGGNDNTEEVVKSFCNDQIKYFRKDNEERGAARNFGWERAIGRYVTFLDSDDILYPDHLEKAFDFLIENDPVCYAQAYEIRKALTNKLLVKGYTAEEGDTINSQIIKGNFLSCFGVFLKREVFDEVRFDENRRFAGTEDWLLWLQLAARYPFYYNNSVTGALLEHDDRSVLSFNEESLLFRTEFLKKKLEEDDVFLKKFGKGIQKIYAHMLTYTALHLAISRKKSDAFRYWAKGLKFDINELFSKRSLVIMKKILLH